MRELCKKNRRKRNNNEGFSLVEVLLAVVLLGLIAAPILQMFYSSFAMSQKSRVYLAAADLAQTKLEDISSRVYDSTDADDLGFKQAYGETGVDTDEVYQGYRFKVHTECVDLGKVNSKDTYWNYEVTCTIDYVDKKGVVHDNIEQVKTTILNQR